ncbi:DUF4399 domain-containing protein [Caenispirillum salinarum]|uniref:DUF4399 domain-containing protein n=1 Tax=Caenispirillum salinarum TaxID=859058 RepID=UPI00384B81BA
MKRAALLAAAVLLAGGLSAPVLAQNTKAPEGARLYIIWPNDGAVINGGKFWLRMGLENMGVVPATIPQEGAGHHHVLINTDLPPADEPIPNDRNHLHFGGGQTEARIELPRGRHTLQLVLADHDHYMFDPPLVSEKITIIVP